MKLNETLCWDNRRNKRMGLFGSARMFRKVRHYNGRYLKA